MEILYWSLSKQHWAPVGPFGCTAAPLDPSLTIAALAGKGPAKGEIRKGLGTRMIGALVQQLNATLEAKTDPQGYKCELFVPRPR
jgi:two-component sensor histidine kinase